MIMITVIYFVFFLIFLDINNSNIAFYSDSTDLINSSNTKINLKQTQHLSKHKKHQLSKSFVSKMK